MNKQIYVVKVINEYGGTDFYCDRYASMDEAEKCFASDLPECKIVEIKNIGE